MPLKIIGTGLGRTGTYSLKVALEHLGFGKTYHMTELFQYPEGIKYFNEAEKGKDVNWEELFKNYSSAVDYPVVRYFRQITEYYPDAKVIHTVRDPEEWYQSAKNTILKSGNLTLSKFIKFGFYFFVSENVRRRLPALLYSKKLMKLEFEDIKNKQKAIKRYEQHSENVIRYVSSSRILMYNITDGWEPLCRFLNVPVPAENFPRTNGMDDFKKKVDIIGTGRYLPKVKLEQIK